MVMHRVKGISILMVYLRWILAIVFSIPVACRSAAETGEPFPKNLASFDASLPDGGVAEPVAACLDGEPLFNNNFSPSLGGDESLDVEVIHFSSFYCGYCADFYSYSHALWRSRSDFRERARIYFHHASYYFRHRAAVAAHNQGEGYFWELHDFIFDGLLLGDAPSEGDILKYVEQELELDMPRFKKDLESDETYAFLKWEIEQGKAAGVKGTPTAYVCGDEINWLDLEDEVADRL